MNAPKAVFRREFVARRDLLLLAFAVMLIAVLMPLVPGTGRNSASEVRSLASQVLAFGLGCCVAIGLGISVVGSDLSAGRLGFYFARPVTARAIWTGKVLASLAVIFACEGVVILPALVAERAQFVGIGLQGWLAILCAFVLLPSLLFLFSHALGIMGRARTAWLVLDLVGLVMCAVGSWLAIRPLYVLGAGWAVFVVGGSLALAITAAIAVAGCVGLAAGRTDLRRTHGAMSVVLWALVGAALVGLATYSAWLRDFGPSEMNDVEVVSVSPDGQWLEVWGGAPWRLDVRRRALISGAGNLHVTLPVSWNGYGPDVVYSAGGGTALGLGGVSERRDPVSLWWVDLTAGAPTIEETNLVVPPRAIPVLAPDGTRVALLENGTLSVYDLASEKLVTAVRLPARYRRATVLFPERGRVRVFARSEGEGAWTTLIAEVDLESHEVEETGRVDGGGDRRWMIVDSSAAHMIFVARESRGGVVRRSLRDARTGALIRELDPDWSVRFLADGRLVSLVHNPTDGARLVVESADGATRIEHPLGVAEWEGFGGEALPGQVVVGRIEALDERAQGRRYEVIDVDSGAIRPIADGLRRAHDGYQTVWGGGGMILWSVDAPEANRIFTDRTGAVVRWDPETAQLVHIVGGTD